MSIRGIVLCAVALLYASTAEAKATFESPYSYDQTFGTALRLLKVDLDVEVSETNADWGYVIFVYTSRESGKRKNRGTFSFVRLDNAVQVTLQLPELPSYHEQHIVGLLRRKLEEEHGAPPPVPKKKPAPPKDEKQKDKKKKDKPDDARDDATQEPRDT